jgi:hypothetical protein
MLDFITNMNLQTQQLVVGISMGVLMVLMIWCSFGKDEEV